MKLLFPKAHIYLISLLFLFSSCQKEMGIETGATEPPTDLPELTQKNISYSNTHERNKLDVQLVAKRNTNNPFVILIHGGAWVEGDKQDMNFLQDSLAKRGINSVSMNYRYASSSVHFTQLMEDVDKVIQFLLSKNEDWHIRNTKFVLIGASAGAHLSLLYGYKFDNENRIGAIVSASGPTNIASTDWLNYIALLGVLPSVEKMVGASYNLLQPLPAAFTEASPIHHLKNVPTLILHGDQDKLVPYQHASDLNHALEQKNYTKRLVPFGGADHDLGVINNPGNLQIIIREVVDWVNKYGK